jgi:CubicO group peptidase (beta-lactamase class C family)
MGEGLTDEGLRNLHETLARHVESGAVPGLVALVARGDDVHVETIGHPAIGDAEPIRQDAIFRIASITKPIVGVVAMLLIEDGLMALGDPIVTWLPELADQRVLWTLESVLDDTVPMARPITVLDVLSFQLGWGSIMAPPDQYPIQAAEKALDLRSFGPPWPPSDHTPDSWIAALGSLPMLDQPGVQWRYAGGAQVAGVLVERVAKKPIADLLRERVCGPLGMADTDFYVPADKLYRFTTQYESDATGTPVVLDRPAGWWSVPPSMPDANGWLVSTVDDLWAFARMLMADGGDLLSAESVRAMLADRLTAEQRADNAIFFPEHVGWGLMTSVPSGNGATGIPGGFGWDGGTGTSWRTDPATGLTGILLTQLSMLSPEPPTVMGDFWTAAYAALA